MSDPVSNREIEDVLSSIRRLVSVENRGERKDSGPSEGQPASPESDAEDAPEGHAAAEPQSRPAQDAKLVLTPSFRVKESHDTADVAADPEDDSPERGDDSLSLDQWQITPERDADDTDTPQQSDHADANAESGQDAISDAGVEDDAPHEDADPETLSAFDVGEEAPEEDHDESARTDGEGDLGDEEKALAEAFVEADFAMPEDTAVIDENADDEVTSREAERGCWSSDRELEARIAEVEAAVAARQDAWEPEAEDSGDYAARKGAPLPWDQFDFTEDEDDESPTEASETDDGHATSDPEEHVPEPEALDEGLTEAAPEMPEPDTDTPDGPLTEEDAAEEKETAPESGPVANVASEATMLAAMRASRAEALARRSELTTEEPISSRQEMLDFVSSRTAPDQKEPEGPEATEASMERDADHDADETTLDQQEAETDPKEAREWYSDDAVMDEDALRDLVADIVRQELQGALGERITRNVRKLVRREIHRAMMGQDFD